MANIRLWHGVRTRTKPKPRAATHHSAIADETGSAIVEFIFTSTLIIIPMIYLVLAAGQLQGASYAAVGAADQAAKVFAASEQPAQADTHARDAVSRTLSDFGIATSRSTTEIACTPACLEPGSTVTVAVRIQVPLPFLPESFGTSVFSVDSTATQRVDRFG